MLDLLVLPPMPFLYYFLIGTFFARVWWSIHSNGWNKEVNRFDVALAVFLFWPVWIMWRLMACVIRGIFAMADWVGPKLSDKLTGK